MIDLEYANAYSEVLEILKYIPKLDYEKIPNDMIELFEINHNKEYKIFYDINKTLDEQNVSKKAKTIIAILYRDYWANEKQREKILLKEKYDMQKQMEEKIEKYNPKDLFKNIQKIEDEELAINDLTTETKKENIFQKTIKFFKKIFKI